MSMVSLSLAKSAASCFQPLHNFSAQPVSDNLSESPVLEFAWRAFNGLLVLSHWEADEDVTRVSSGIASGNSMGDEYGPQ